VALLLARRTFLIGAAALAAGCGPRGPNGSPHNDAAEPMVQDRIGLLEDSYDATVGLYGVNLEDGRTISRQDDRRFAVCSTFKAYLAARVLQLAQRGALALTDTEFIDPAALVTHSPLTAPRAGGAMSLAELCRAVLQHSDNTAANLLLSRIGGPTAITAFARSIGDDRTRLDRWETALNSALPGDPRDTSTPRAIGGGIAALLTGSVLDDVHRGQLERWMRGHPGPAHSIRAGLPPGWTTADKTGAGGFGSTNDIGIAYGPAGERILLSIMTRTRTDDPDAQWLQPLITDVTALVLPELSGVS